MFIYYVKVTYQAALKICCWTVLRNVMDIYLCFSTSQDNMNTSDLRIDTYLS